jgi:hypothetical protein
MNTIYIVRTMTECVNTFDGDKSHRVCDVDTSTTLFLLLSTPALTVFAGHVCDACLVPIARHNHLRGDARLQVGSCRGPQVEMGRAETAGSGARGAHRRARGSFQPRASAASRGDHGSAQLACDATWLGDGAIAEAGACVWWRGRRKARLGPRGAAITTKCLTRSAITVSALATSLDLCRGMRVQPWKHPPVRLTIRLPRRWPPCSSDRIGQLCSVRAVWHNPAQIRSVGSSGDVMTPFGALNLSTSDAQARAAARVLPITPRTRARSDQFNPEAEHALLPCSQRLESAEGTASALCDPVVPYAELGGEEQVLDCGGAPSGNKLHPLSSCNTSNSRGSDGSEDEEGRAVLDSNAERA